MRLHIYDPFPGTDGGLHLLEAPQHLVELRQGVIRREDVEHGRGVGGHEDAGEEAASGFAVGVFVALGVFDGELDDAFPVVFAARALRGEDVLDGVSGLDARPPASCGLSALEGSWLARKGHASRVPCCAGAFKLDRCPFAAVEFLTMSQARLKQLYTLPELAEIVGCHRTRIWQLVAAGKISAERVGHYWLVRQDEVARVLRTVHVLPEAKARRFAQSLGLDSTYDDREGTP